MSGLRCVSQFVSSQLRSQKTAIGQRLLIGGSSSTRLMIIILWQADQDPPAIRRSCMRGWGVCGFPVAALVLVGLNVL